MVMRKPDLREQEADVIPLLESAFATVVEELGGGEQQPLVFVPRNGVAALRCFYRLCLALADRTMEDAAVRSLVQVMPPAATTASEALSADLALRHLPELHQLARSLSEGDPLAEVLEAAALRFPLSGVGITLKEPPDLALLQGHASLWRLYLDRVIERQDGSRLNDPAVCAGIRDSLGLHPELASKLAAQLALAAA